MEATAILRFSRLSPRRTRIIADAVRGKRVDEALTILELMTNKPSNVMKKVLKSAIANAGNKEGMDSESLFISKLLIGQGPVWKRFMPRAMGRATTIRKTTSHIDLTLSDGYKPKKSKEKRKMVLAKKAKEASRKKAIKKSRAKKETKAKSDKSAEKKQEN